MVGDLRAGREQHKWDQESGGYDEWQSSYGDLYREITTKIAAHLNPNSKVVEIGCGTGLVTFDLAPRANSIKALDISEKMIAIAQSKSDASAYDNIEFMLGDAYFLPFEDSSFDVALCCYLFDIIEQPETVLREVHRVLNQSGILISVTDCYRGTRPASSARIIAREVAHMAQRAMHRVGMVKRRSIRPRDWELARWHNDAGFQIQEASLLKGREREPYQNMYITATKF